MGNSQLIHFSKARQELALAKSIDEVKDIRDKAEALRAYAKQAGMSLEMQNGCAEIKLRAERRAGEMLMEMKKNPGTVLGGNIVKPPSELPKLEDIGITKIQSHRWQLEASVPDELFEQHITAIITKAQELTSIGFLRIAVELKREAERKANQILVSQTPPFPNVKAKTILIDPPWDWGDEADVDQFGRARPTYVTTPFEELLELPLGELADQDSHIYLWITNRSLPKGFELLKVWWAGYEKV